MGPVFSKTTHKMGRNSNIYMIPIEKKTVQRVEKVKSP